MLESLAFQEFHAKEGLTVVIVDLVDRADVRMIESRSRARFPLKPLQRLRIAGELRRQKLESDVAAEFEVFGLVNHSHASASKHCQDAVVRDSLADHGVREWLW